LNCAGATPYVPASSTSTNPPGGYGDAGADTNIGAQFTLSDQRTLDEVMGSLIARELIPSFCAACYRMERTGEAFMSMAKPGTIKGKCNINALVTLREYLDDFASPAVRREGYRLIERAREQLNENDRALLERLFAGIEAGRRDAYV
jgi:2-iminoacetate synthase